MYNRNGQIHVLGTHETHQKYMSQARDANLHHSDWLKFVSCVALDLCFDDWVVIMWVRDRGACVLTIIASLHPGVNGYLWVQSWLLCLISLCAEVATIELYTPPGGWDGFRNDLCAWWAGGNNVKRCDTSCKSAIKMPSLLFIRALFCCCFQRYSN